MTDTGAWRWVVHQTEPESIENQSKVHLLDIKKAPQSVPLEPIWPQLGPHGPKAHFGAPGFTPLRDPLGATFGKWDTSFSKLVFYCLLKAPFSRLESALEP